jgi:hypothetical protein
MPLPNLKTDSTTNLQVRRTETKPWLTPDMMSPIGKELWQLASEIEQSDEPALDEAAIERELQRRKGGYVEDGK